MPSGTGKTMAMLSATISYQIHSKNLGIPLKIVYCSRTVSEIEKALSELKVLIDYIKSYIEFNFLGIGLSSRYNMCINKAAFESSDVDIACRKMVNRLNNMKCDFFENSLIALPPGVYTLNDIKEFSIEYGICPYYLARESLGIADCIIYSYNYLIDLSIYSLVSKKLPKETIVIFDEAHNIDSYCIESLSIEINRGILESSCKLISALGDAIKNKIEEIKTLKKGKENVADAYREKDGVDPVRIDKKLNQAIECSIPYFIIDDEYESIPGNIRNSLHFLSILKRLVEFLKTKLKSTHLTTDSTNDFVHNIYELTFIQRKTLKFCSYRLGLLTSTLGFEDDDLWKLRRVADFGTQLVMYSKGFLVIFEPFDTISSGFNPVLRLCCLDASVGIKHVFENYKNVIITSGTLSPLDMYPKILNFVPAHSYEIGATLERNQICPMIITKGNDQVFLRNDEILDHQNDNGKREEKEKGRITTSFSLRTESSVVRNYGSLLINLCKVVPDNILCFFPSYIYMEEIVTIWSEMGMIREMQEEKLVFVETPDGKETALALENFKKACESGRGGVFFSVARGKVSEGIDFEHGFARAVVLMGIPFMYTESVKLKERLKFLKMEYGINEFEFLVFDAMRHAAQCLGRVLRNKKDYGLMIMADSRFGSQKMHEKMPKWICQRIEQGNIGLSIDMGINICKAFFREMAQPFNEASVNIFKEDDIKEFLKKII